MLDLNDENYDLLRQIKSLNKQIYHVQILKTVIKKQFSPSNL